MVIQGKSPKLFLNKFIDNTGPVRLVGRWAWITSIFGIFSILLNFVILFIGTSYGYLVVSQPCEDPCQIYGQLNAANFQDLQKLGASATTYATTYVIILWVFAVIAYTTAGFLLWKKPGELVPFGAAVLIMSLPSVEGQFVFFGGVFQDYPLLGNLYYFFNIISGLLSTYAFLTFPNGRFKAKIFWLLFIVLAVAPTLLAIYQFIFNIPSDFDLSIPSMPLAFVLNFLTVIVFYTRERNFSLRNTAKYLLLAVVGCLTILVNASFIGFLVTLFALIYRLRVLTPRERVSTKWLIYGSVFFNSILIFFFIILPLFPAILAPGSYWFIFINIVGFFGCGINMIGILMAILYANAFDINLVIKRTLVYTALTLLIVGIYIGSIIGLQALVSVITGQQSDLAIVGATLVSIILFQPLRKAIQNFMDRRFYRRKYDAARTIAKLHSRLKTEMDLKTLTGQIKEVVNETMEPRMVSVWVKVNPLQKVMSV